MIAVHLKQFIMEEVNKKQSRTWYSLSLLILNLLLIFFLFINFYKTKFWEIVNHMAMIRSF